MGLKDQANAYGQSFQNLQNNPVAGGSRPMPSPWEAMAKPSPVAPMSPDEPGFLTKTWRAMLNTLSPSASADAASENNVKTQKQVPAAKPKPVDPYMNFSKKATGQDYQ